MEFDLSQIIHVILTVKSLPKLLPPLPLCEPGAGGLFKYSLTFRQKDSSLSVLGSYNSIKFSK